MKMEIKIIKIEENDIGWFVIGNIDNSRMIETKREADEIIDSIIKIINETSV